MIGKTLSHYKIIESLGKGGMGEVYRARDTSLNRDVALKLLPTEIADDPTRCERFKQEAQAVASLSHPNIMAIFEFGSDEGRSFAAMELLEGVSLGERLQEGPMQLRKVIDLAVQIADGLDAAHERGVVHRDIKPDNILITTDGRAKILDFGLARVGSSSSDSAQTAISPALTEPGVVMGTVGYMSPEQVRGERVDARGDIFSLGVVLYEMLTSSRAFEGESAAEIMGSILRDEPMPIRERNNALPETLERVIDHCLEKTPEERFQSARDLGFALANTLSTSGPELQPAETTIKAHGAHRSPLLWMAGLGWMAALAVLGFHLFRSPEPPSAVRLRTLTYSGHDWAPAASSAGDMIAFVSDRDGTSRIWLKQVAGGGEAPISEGSDDVPRFSPDGSQILFTRAREGTRDLYRMAVVGGQPRKILGDVLEADWSPDGTRVAFLRMKPEGEGNLILIGEADAQTGEERILANIANRLCYGVRWSPNGRRIALCEASLSGMAVGRSYIDMIDIRSGDLQRLTLTDWSGPYTALQWGPAGRSLLVGQATGMLARASASPSQIMEYDLESQTRRPLLWALLNTPWGARGFSTIAVLNAHQFVIDEHAVLEGLREVAWTEDDSIAPTQTLTGGLGRDRQPAYSPDGQRIIFSSNRSGNVDLWVIDRRTHIPHQLTDDPANDWDPAFTPDGRHVLWSSDRSGNMEIWMANADGSRARQVTHDGVDAENPTMTPDGAWIIYASANDENRGVWRIRPDGSDVTLLASGSYLIPEVSPDGRHALFVRHSGVNYVILVVEIESSEMVPFEIRIHATRLHQNIMFGRARWMPNGHAITYIGENSEGLSGVFAQDFVPGSDTSDSRRPVAGFSAKFTTESLAVSPDGRNIIISALVDQRSLKLADYVSLSGWN